MRAAAADPLRAGQSYLWLEYIEQLSPDYAIYAPTLRHFGEAGTKKIWDTLSHPMGAKPHPDTYRHSAMR